MAIHATYAVLAIAGVIAIALCFVFIVTLAIRKSNKKKVCASIIIHDNLLVNRIIIIIILSYTYTRAVPCG